MKRRKFAIGVLVVASITTAILATYFLTLKNTEKKVENVNDAIRVVSRHYLLPENEKPALATVEDISRVKSEFFRSGKNGDKLLVYKDAKLVILYRPSIDKIIEVGPISIASASGLN